MNALQHLKDLFGSQKAIADALGIGESAVSMWHTTGVPDAQKWRLMAICKDKGLPLEIELLMEKSDNDPSPRRVVV